MVVPNLFCLCNKWFRQSCHYTHVEIISNQQLMTKQLLFFKIFYFVDAILAQSYLSVVTILRYFHLVSDPKLSNMY